MSCEGGERLVPSAAATSFLAVLDEGLSLKKITSSSGNCGIRKSAPGQAHSNEGTHALDALADGAHDIHHHFLLVSM